ncbi:AMP-binding protein (plasmid) [Tistrella bauzanensis]|uniref:TtbB n=1 Tax=Tistrella bauzanensis TaxID=657419 RepID=L7VG74_9PROT|nr:TtbB [Tistrella bauzanensis]
MKIGDLLLDDPTPAPAAKPRALPAAAPDVTIIDLFDRAVAAHPDRLAVRDAVEAVSYTGLQAEARAIARLVAGATLGDEARVGVMTGRGWRHVAAMLGVMMARAAFVPLDPAIPLPRRRQIVETAGITMIIADSPRIGDLHALAWTCPGVRDLVCLDSDDIDALTETHGARMNAELWDHLAGSADDDVAAAGWRSPFTGGAIPEPVMTEFGRAAAAKMAALLPPRARVLEIGCASGFTMRALAPHAGQYLATDISRRATERAGAVAARAGLTQVDVRPLAAHDLDLLNGRQFDLIVINSVIESFPGFGYLSAVLSKAAALLAPGGAIFLGNIRDLERRDAYRADLAAFARAHAGESTTSGTASGITTRLDAADDLFVPAGFFTDWAARLGGFRAEASPLVVDGFDLAPYVYDMVLRRDPAATARPPRHRRHDRRALAPRPAAAPLPAPTPGMLAYVLFTSGTTGAPKGAMIEHGSVANLAMATDAAMYARLRGGRDAGSDSAPLNIPCLAPFAFDASVIQILPTLAHGHHLHVACEETRRNPPMLDRFLRARMIDMIDLTPSLFDLMLDHWQAEALFCPVRLVVLGGEAVSAGLMARIFDNPVHRDLLVLNAYGPTECCVGATTHLMTARTWREILPPPVGMPLSGVVADIRDAAGRPVPDGVAGEIWIGGAGVGRGYLGADAAADARFVTDDTGARWYRSGDIGRRLSGGAIHVIGREDGQVKIRGNRLELAEVEAAVLAHPFIRQAAVTTWTPPDGGGAELVACVVPAPGFDAGRCRADLDTRLPPAMVPSRIVQVAGLPLTGNGKLDRRRLDAMLSDQSDAGRAPAAGQTASAPARPLASDDERRVAQIMAAVLETPVDDGDADFFRLGGHSVLAVQMVDRLRLAFDVRLPLADLFDHPTVARLALRLRHQAQGRRSRLVVVNEAGREPPLVCFHPVGGNVLCYQAMTACLGPDQPVVMVEAKGLDEDEAPEPSVEEMVAASLPDLIRFAGDRPLRLAGWSFGGLLAVEAAHRLDQAGIVVEDVLIFDAVASADPIRALLAKDDAAYLAALFDGMGIADAATFRALDPEGRLDLLITRGAVPLGLPQGVDRDAMRRLLSVFQNNALAAIRYRVPRLDRLQALLVRPRIASAQAPGIAGDPFNGWRDRFGGGVSLVWMDGSHGDMMMPPHVEELARLVRAHLTRPH